MSVSTAVESALTVLPFAFFLTSFLSRAIAMEVNPNKRSVRKKEGGVPLPMRERILEESVKLFLRKGFSGASIKDITEAVNLSKGSLYWHFKSKNDLLEAIIGQFERGFLDGLIESVNAVRGGFTEKFNRYHKHVTEFAVKTRDLSLVFTTLSAELSGSGTEAERQIRNMYAKYHAFVKELLELGKRDGKIKKELDTDVVTHVIIAFHDGIFLEWYRHHETLDGRVLAKTFRDIVLGGIIK
jgi:AcrR family transcriptional regulator